ncbi:flagellar protein F [Natronococcus occultus]|uniref:Putative archaeal flagellar protein F n=1 Tax=Natronococcus occultus SP4 TaxID=694430 RepID=L0JYH2_9EURY|nr:flagellar protein F [Natronococcus occultus]AGB38107.1 putative archaeal flagellar protein F [Natronococcus occultus SP4]
MGFSTSGATAVILVGVLVAVSVAYPALQSAQDLRQNAIEDRDNRALEAQNAAVADVEVEHADGELTVTARNDGASSLSAADTTVLVDGTLPADRETTIDGESDHELWLPEEELTVTVETEDLPEDPERIKLVTEHGVAITESI